MDYFLDIIIPKKEMETVKLNEKLFEWGEGTYSCSPPQYISDSDIVFEQIEDVQYLNKIIGEELTNDTRTKKEITYFDDFESYSAFLDDEIYDDACYYQCDSSKIRSGIDQDRLFEKKCFVEDTIDNYTATSTAEEISLYRKAEKLKKLIKKWIDKFYSCSTADELRRVVQNYSKSKLSTELAGDSWYLARCYRDFFMWQYIFSALDDKKDLIY